MKLNQLSISDLQVIITRAEKEKTEAQKQYPIAKTKEAKELIETHIKQTNVWITIVEGVLQLKIESLVEWELQF